MLTRRREAYHEAPPHGGGPSPEHPPYDADDRALFVDRVLADDLARDAYEGARYTPLVSWARAAMAFRIEATPAAVVVTLASPTGMPPLEKQIRVAADGALAVSYRWDAAGMPSSGRFAPELTLAAALDVELDPATDVWRFPVETVAKSERGLERTRQGESVTPSWPLAAGAARIGLGVRAP